MEIATTIEAICKLAKDFEERGNVSMIALLKESGYLENSDQITEAQIPKYLKDHPDLVATWILQSENKRTDNGMACFFSGQARLGRLTSTLCPVKTD